MNHETLQTSERIESAVQNLRTTLKEELSDLERNLKAASGDIHAKVAELKSLCKKLQLDQKLLAIYEEVKNYPQWSTREDWLQSKYRLCEIDDPKGAEREKERDISFSLHGHLYKLTYHDEGSRLIFGDYVHLTQLSLRDGFNNLLIEIRISVDVDQFGVMSKPDDVNAFVPGTWMQDILECYEKFQANKTARNIREKYDQEKVQNLKEKFGIE